MNQIDVAQDGVRKFKISDLAEMMSCSEQTIRRAIQDGELRASKHGGRTSPWVIEEPDAYEFLVGRDFIVPEGSYEDLRGKIVSALLAGDDDAVFSLMQKAFRVFLEQFATEHLPGEFLEYMQRTVAEFMSAFEREDATNVAHILAFNPLAMLMAGLGIRVAKLTDKALGMLDREARRELEGHLEKTAASKNRKSKTGAGEGEQGGLANQGAPDQTTLDEDSRNVDGAPAVLEGASGDDSNEGLGRAHPKTEDATGSDS